MLVEEESLGGSLVAYSLMVAVEGAATAASVASAQVSALGSGNTGQRLSATAVVKVSGALAATVASRSSDCPLDRSSVWSCDDEGSASFGCCRCCGSVASGECKAGSSSSFFSFIGCSCCALVILCSRFTVSLVSGEMSVWILAAAVSGVAS